MFRVSSQGMLGAAGLTSQMASTTAGGIVGYQAGGIPGAVIGGAAGAMGALVGPKMLRAAADRISRMMLLEPGRVALARIFKESKGTLGRDALVALFNTGRASLMDIANDEPNMPSQTRSDRPQSVSDWERLGFDFKKGNR